MFPSSSLSSSSEKKVQNNEITADEVKKLQQKWQRDIIMIEIRSNLLEKILTRRLIVEGGSSEEEDDDYDELEEQLKAVQYMIRYDSHWLKCYQPNFPLMTILGLIEDDHSHRNEQDDVNFSLFDDFILQCHIISSSSCPLGGVAVKENNNNNNNNGNSSDNIMINQVTTASSSFSQTKMKKLQWIDLRQQHRQHNENNNGTCNNNKNVLPLLKWKTPGDCYTLLQSILGYDHDSSPWNNCINDETNNSKDNNNNRLSSSSSSTPLQLQSKYYDICILVLPFNNNSNDDTDDYGNSNDVGTNNTNKTNNALKEFRVSDASPSWFLHSIVNCDYMEYNGNCLTTTTTTVENKNGYYDYNITTNANSNSTTSSSSSEGGAPATLFIYKRLPLRPGFINDININNNENNTDDVEDDDDVVVVEENLPTDLSLATSLGCLWEIDAVSTDDGNDGDGAAGDQRSSQPNNNNMNGSNKENTTERRQQLLRRRLQCPPYLDLSKLYNPSIYQQLFSSKAIETFMNEAIKIPQWTPWPETQHYSSSKNNNGDGGDHHATWTVFPLCYCFPANDVSKRTWVDATTAYCPKTCQILLHVLGPLLRTALFSQLSPNTTLAAHTGWMDLANHVLRLHIPLIVPSKCGTWVDGVIKLHEKGKPVLFDDSKIHRAFNYSNQVRIVLIVDIERPNTSLPIGYATGGHSDELDSFIQQMSMPK